MKEYIIDANEDPGLINNVLDDSWPPRLRKQTSDWLDENCSAKWYYNEIVTLPGEYNEGLSFQFEEESDFVGFKLRWS